jgi:hypothetical protein
MMYNQKLAVALKSAGSVLREFGETVYIPFGSEYSVLIKNLNSVRALVKVEIDGVDVGDGQKFVLNANSDVELERFIKNANLKNGNKFKFIERTANIEQHRGIGVGDGLVRVEFNFEKVYAPQPYWANSGYLTFTGGNTGEKYRGIVGSTVNYCADVKASANIETFTSTTMDFMDTDKLSKPRSIDRSVIDAGITVPGSVSDQKFQSVNSFPTETETHVIVLQLLGQTEDNVQVVKPVTVKAKPKCSTCGRTNKATAKFCTECGTSLTIV